MGNKNPLDPEITLTANCHNCGEMVTYGQIACPHCGIELDQEEIIPSVINNFVITQAVSSANNLRSFDLAVIFFLAPAVYIMFYPELFWLQWVTTIGYLIPLIFILGWFLKHGNWESEDPDYEFSKKEVKAGMRLWLGAHFFNGVTFFINWMKWRGRSA